MFIIKLMTIINIILSLFSTNEPVVYTSEDLTLDKRIQQVHTLEVDLNNPSVSVINALSFGKIYGFEKTSVMVKDNEAIAGFNGMFYNIYGHHIGLLVKNYKIVTKPYDYTPVIAFLKSGKVFIGELNTQIKVKSKSNTIIIDSMNDVAYGGKWVLYSSIYGNSTRITRDSINYIINNNKVIKKLITNEPVKIPKNGFVLSKVTVNNDNKILKVNEEVEIETIYTPEIGDVKEAFQSGGWLVKDSVNVAKNYEVLMGNTMIPNPRTILGVTNDNKLIIKVIDGRQPNYSYGVTGKTCAKIMLDEGCINAVYLDGGASSTMVYKDKVVNSPSNKEERKVAHSLVINYERNMFKELLTKLKNWEN